MAGPGLANTGTMQGVINYGKKLDISHAKLHFKSLLDSDTRKIIINNSSILDKYFDLIKRNIVTYEMSDIEFMKYKFQPKLLSYDLYKTTELWSSLLKINNLFSASEFTKQKIKIFNDSIFEILNEIMILEETEIKANNKQVYIK